MLKRKQTKTQFNYTKKSGPIVLMVSELVTPFLYYGGQIVLMVSELVTPFLYYVVRWE